MFHLAALALSLALRVLSTLHGREHEPNRTLSCASVAHVETKPYTSHQLPISFIMDICTFWKFLSFKIKCSYACPFPLLLMGRFLMVLSSATFQLTQMTSQNTNNIVTVLFI